jgi:Rrf2 family protein
MLRLNATSDIALQILHYLAQRPNVYYGSATLAQSLHISLPMIKKTLYQLQTHQLLQTKPGSKGGYRLASNAPSRSLYDILSHTENTTSLVPCQQTTCHHSARCATKTMLDHINNQLMAVLKNLCLADFITPNTLTTKDMQ